MKRGTTRVYVYIFAADSSRQRSMREEYLVTYRAFWIDAVGQGPGLVEDEIPPCKSCFHDALAGEDRVSEHIHTLHFLPSLLEKPSFAHYSGSLNGIDGERERVSG
jgi:hypothetical protein